MEKRSFMNFIRDIRNKRDNNKKNPLDEYSMYNFNDVLNDIYIIDDLREKGDEKGAKAAYESFVRHGVSFKVGDSNVDNFLSYLIAKSQLNGSTISTTDLTDNENTDLTDNEKLVSAVIIQESRDTIKDSNISYETLCKFLDLSHARNATLTNDEYSQLSGYPRVKESNMYKSITKKLVKNYPIPDVTHIDDIYDTDDLSDLYDLYGKDSYFSSNYKIKNVYAIAPNKQSANASKQ